jgi:hypothetical protein
MFGFILSTQEFVLPAKDDRPLDGITLLRFTPAGFTCPADGSVINSLDSCIYINAEISIASRSVPRMEGKQGCDFLVTRRISHDLHIHVNSHTSVLLVITVTLRALHLFCILEAALSRRNRQLTLLPNNRAEPKLRYLINAEAPKMIPNKRTQGSQGRIGMYDVMLVP